MFLRSDYGTENCSVAALQIAFHLKNCSGLREKSYIYGPSKSNIVKLIRIRSSIIYFRKLKVGGHNLGGSKHLGG